MLIADRLEMLVTGDPAGELDDALAFAGRQWHAAREHGDHETAERLAKWIDLRLDERRAIRWPAAPTASYHCEATGQNW